MTDVSSATDGTSLSPSFTVQCEIRDSLLRDERVEKLVAYFESKTRLPSHEAVQLLRLRGWPSAMVSPCSATSDAFGPDGADYGA